MRRELTQLECVLSVEMAVESSQLRRVGKTSKNHLEASTSSTLSGPTLA
jgi:hypothetical protein